MIAILLCITYLNKFIEPKIFPYLGLLALIYPILIAIYLLFTIYWIIKREKVFIPFFIFTFFLLFPIKKFVHLGEANHEQITNNELKILTYNIRYANNNKDLQALENYITQKDVDIAFFHEIYTRQWRSKEIFLAERYNAAFDLIGISSKYPIINEQKIILPNNGFAGMVDIQKDQDIIRCFSIYLEPMYLNKNIFKISTIAQLKNNLEIITDKLLKGFKKHEVQIDLLTKYIKESPYPVIVCGDFNSVPLSYEYFTLKKDLVDVFEKSGKGLGWTFYDYYYPIRIDYIFVNNDFKSKLCYVDRNVNFSDHYPVLATLELK
ncbi:endonuclease/exonuclease/phosphatase family protein [Apibacter mensalis]|uniref:endonuclease/exonuclease/phosphatase family protein n=1 Tax=Apibacter mensalis TaxID=1586267 RepID=UPI001427E560|nr:endonuclease/exonuclease/phosphatase family protein [Apibacter mensalis]